MGAIPGMAASERMPAAPRLRVLCGRCIQPSRSHQPPSCARDQWLIRAKALAEVGEKVYGVGVLPGAIPPMTPGLKIDEIRRVIIVGEPELL